jgi:hypothetical protein
MRVEQDSLGPVNVPADKLWGAQTQRSLEHFSIGDDLIPREMIPAYAIVKKAAAHSGLSPAQLAGGFLRSAEADARRVGRYYRDHLGRAEDTGEGQAWLSMLQSGLLRPAQVAAALLACDEFFARAGTGVLDPAP